MGVLGGLGAGAMTVQQARDRVEAAQAERDRHNRVVCDCGHQRGDHYVCGEWPA